MSIFSSTFSVGNSVCRLSDKKVALRQCLASLNRDLDIVVPLRDLYDAMIIMETRYVAWNDAEISDMCCEAFILEGLRLKQIPYDYTSPHNSFKSAVLPGGYITVVSYGDEISAVSQKYLTNYVGKFGYTDVNEFLEYYTYGMTNQLLADAKADDAWAFTFMGDNGTLFDFPEVVPGVVAEAAIFFLSTRVYRAGYVEAANYIDEIFGF